MKKVLNLALCLALATPTNFIFAQNSSTKDESTTKAFLSRMGFVAASGSDHELEIAKEIAERFVQRLQEKSSPLAAEVVVKTLLIGPLPIADEYPTEIRTEADLQKKQKLIDDYLQRITAQRIHDLKRNIISDLISAIYTESEVETAVRRKSEQDYQLLSDIVFFTEKVSQYINRVFSQEGKRNTQYLGKALLLATLRQAKLNEDKLFEHQLKKSAASWGVDLQLHAGANLAVMNDKKQLENVALETSDLIFDREIEITDFTKDILQKMDRGEKPKMTERAKFWFNQTNLGNQGYNGASIVSVITDPETGIKTTWLFKQVKQGENAKLLQVGLEQLTYEARLQVVKLNPEQLMKSADDEGFLARLKKQGPQVWIKAFRESLSQWLLVFKDREQGKDTTGTGLIEKAFLASSVANLKIQNFKIKSKEFISTLKEIKFQRQTIINKYANQFSTYTIASSAKMQSLIYSALSKINFSDISQNIKDLYAMNLLLAENAVNLGKSKLSALAWFKYQPLKQTTGNNLADQEADYHSIEKLDAKEKYKLAKEYRKYLQQLGFENLPAQIRENLKNNNFSSEANRRQAERNLKSYINENAGVDLALSIVTEMLPALEKSDIARAKLAKFTAKMLTLKPMTPITKYPPHIEQAAKEGRDEVVNQYHFETVRPQMEHHTRMLVSDIIELVYGHDFITKDSPEVRRISDKIYRQVWRVIERTYMDVQVRQSAFFGDALAGLLRRLSNDLDKKDLLTNLETETKQRDIFLTDFYTDIIQIVNEKGEIIEIKVKDGALLSTRYLQSESFGIGAGTTEYDPERTKQLNVKGDSFAAMLFGAALLRTPEAAKDGLSHWDRLADMISQLEQEKNNNFSHIGQLKLHKVKYVDKFGREHVEFRKRVQHSYPTMAADTTGDMSNTGGAIDVSLNEFINRSKHSRLLVANIDAKLFYEHSMRYIENNKKQAREAIARGEIPKHNPETGYPTDGVIIEEGYKLKWQDNNPVVEEKYEKSPFKAHISEDEFVKLHSIQDPEVWFEQVLNKSSRELTLAVTKGEIFLWVTQGVHVEGGAYCAFHLHLAFLRAAGIPLDMYPGDYTKLVKSIGRLGYDIKRAAAEVDNLNINDELVDKSGQPLGRDSKRVRFLKWLFTKYPQTKSKALAITQNSALIEAMNSLVLNFIVVPSNMIVQPFIKATEIFNVDFKNRPMHERQKTTYEPYVEANPKITRELERVLPRWLVEKYSKFSHMMADITEVINSKWYMDHYAEAEHGATGKINAEKPIGTAVNSLIEKNKSMAVNKCVSVFSPN